MNHTIFNPLVRNHRKPFYRHFNLHDNGHRVPVNIIEADDRFIIEMAVPGFERSEISISLEAGKLTVKGQKNQSDDIRYIRHEWNVANFERSFILGENVQAEKTEASFEAGVLKITVLKTEKQAPLTVDVK